MCAAAAIAWAAPPVGVKVWEQRTNIPTYAAGPAEPSPMFYFGRQSQGARAPVYPYPMWDVLTQKKVDRTYTLVYLENEYLRIGILPEPADARARYYLGNLLFDWQPERAAKLWEESASLDPSFAMVHRNLATAYLHQKRSPDLKRAIAELERAVACERKYPLHFTELGDLYEQAAIPLEKRWPIFERNASVVALRDDALNRSIAIMVALGKYDDAIRAMSSKKFALAEGANLNVSEHWTAAHLLRGRSRLTTGQFKLALQDFGTAVTIPPNLPASYAGTRTNSEAAYWTGIAYEGAGDRQKAIESWTKGAAAAPTAGGRRGGMGFGGFMGSGAQSYWEALCTQKLGDAGKAKGMFQELVNSGQRLMDQPPPSFGGGGRGRMMSPRARSAMAHYTIGLGYLGLNDVTKAKAEFAQSLELSPDLLGARTAPGQRALSCGPHGARQGTLG